VRSAAAEANMLDTLSVFERMDSTGWRLVYLQIFLGLVLSAWAELV